MPINTEQSGIIPEPIHVTTPVRITIDAGQHEDNAGQHEDIYAKFVKEVYIIIVGLGFIIFVSDSPFSDSFLGGLHHDLRYHDARRHLPDITLLINFLATYIFLTYEWIAYNFLIERHPYSVRNHVGSLLRFFLELASLLSIALLTYASTREITLFNSFYMSLLFAMWHAIILLWYWCLNAEGADITKIAWHWHVVMACVLIGYCAILVGFHECRFIECDWRPDVWFLDSEEGIIWWQMFLCLMVVTHAILRLQHFLTRGLGRTVRGA